MSGWMAYFTVKAEKREQQAAKERAQAKADQLAREMSKGRS